MKRLIRLDLILIIFATLCWISLTIFTFQLTLPEWKQPLDDFFHGDIVLVKNLFLCLFFLSTYLFFNDFIKQNKNNQLSWSVMSINLVCLFFHLIILWLEHYAKSPFLLPIWLNFLNNFNILVGTVFSANCFFYFKTLILFEREEHIHKLWNVFQLMIFGSIALTIFNVNLTEPLVAAGLIVYSSFALYLSTQMRWVAFLSKSQKIKTILHYLLYLLILCLILQNFFFESFAFGEDANHLLVIDCAHKFFLLSTFVFVLFYLTSSLLILLFNIPTSSAFEDKMNLTKNYKKLSFNLNKHKEVKDVYKLLLETAGSSSKASYGYIATKTSNKKSNINALADLEESLALQIDDIICLKLKNNSKTFYFGRIDELWGGTPVLIEKNIKTILINPLVLHNEAIGNLVLLSKTEDAFEPDLIEMISSYCLQSCISIENINLFDKAIENERFQEELKIAKRVKEKLLPKQLDFGKSYQSALFSYSSDLIGGDFYETYPLNPNQTFFVIGDVSGNGTSAAFNMAQLKGVFQTTVQNLKDFKQYPKIFNAALLSCLESNSFVSISFFLFDTTQKTIQHYRCGHLPSFLMQKENIEIINPRGIGLGMIENDKIEELLEPVTIKYQSGDMLFCYTDGLIESSNQHKENFGNKRLKNILNNNLSTNPSQTIEDIKTNFFDFLSKQANNEDVTCICIKLP